VTKTTAKNVIIKHFISKKNVQRNVNRVILKMILIENVNVIKITLNINILKNLFILLIIKPAIQIAVYAIKIRITVAHVILAIYCKKINVC
jgi:hypothetical protein